MKRFSRLLQPFEDFFKHQASGGIVLMVATLLALALANSPWAGFYHHFWEFELSLGFGGSAFSHSLHHWINDGLMAVFFFVVGLEIKRELLAGELSTPRKAILPIAAALGGMLVPAGIFLLFAPQLPESRGWGIPMATDIAFALGVIALLGDRIPRSLAIFLTALAIVDDLGAVAVIALFYTGELSAPALTAAALLFLLLAAGNRLGFKDPAFFGLLGVALWLAVLQSGVHASIAGVLVGATIPVRPRYGSAAFLARARQLKQEYAEVETIPGPFAREERLGILMAWEKLCHDAMSPLQRMEHLMHDWIVFGVMPLFALANAGIPLSFAELGTALAHPVTRGVGLGLLLGKPIGILLFTWLAVRLRLCELPEGIGWRQILGIGVLGGIGFTMSLFITSLAFDQSALVADAKVGIFAASLLAGTVGFLLLRFGGRRSPS
jgi:NhaA family Na+:H+ antiporter